MARIKSIEDMAREKLELYMTVIKSGNFVISNGFPPMIAARKAAAANPNFADEIYKIAASM